MEELIQADQQRRALDNLPQVSPAYGNQFSTARVPTVLEENSSAMNSKVVFFFKTLGILTNSQRNSSSAFGNQFTAARVPTGLEENNIARNPNVVRSTAIAVNERALHDRIPSLMRTRIPESDNVTTAGRFPTALEGNMLDRNPKSTRSRISDNDIGAATGFVGQSVTGNQFSSSRVPAVQEGNSIAINDSVGDPLQHS
ncbi:hypothetical protein NE237_032337 [Protea cynaroides]|uniref:Uncharacterized protein n=1 Tax=Protea cynaroides TaxID=273540 RepID=A0A9Q0L3B6_9MAGN|nr:hypothetical protein NE237_032337 [Protea cynaroides]